MIDVALFYKFLIALALGAIIGLEREKAQYLKGAPTYAGIRTFPLIALLGILTGFLGELISPWLLIVNTVIVGSLLVVAYLITSNKNQFGATSEIAGLITYLIGLLVYYNEATLATALAILVAIILYSRKPVHEFVKNLNKEELSSTLKFAVIAFVILPFLPNRGLGPFEMFNPYIIWLMVVFISGISLVGYLMMKYFGERGVELTGIFGGLVSSTAVTTSFAQQSKKTKTMTRALLLGIVLANSIMFIRVLIETFVINRQVFWKLLPSIGALFVISAIISLFVFKKRKKFNPDVSLNSPFTIGPALKFGAFFALILALVKIADIYLSSKGVYVVSFISGFADVDAITVSLSQLAKGDLSLDIASKGILLATLTNVATKGGIAYFLGSKEFGRYVLIAFSILIAVGIGLLFLY